MLVGSGVVVVVFSVVVVVINFVVVLGGVGVVVGKDIKNCALGRFVFGE
jgi:hypothetical protein